MSLPNSTYNDESNKTLCNRNLDKLIPEVYSALKRLAAFHLQNERPNHTLRPAELVHESYLLLHKQHSLDVDDRVYFLYLASTTMRRVLVNHAKRRKRIKRGDGREHIPLDELSGKTLIVFEENKVDVIALEKVLIKLAKGDAQAVKIIELYFYGGLTFDEIAQVLGVSSRTVMREWRFAKTWLYQELKGSN